MGFAIKCHLAQKLVKLPNGVNNHLMTLQLPIVNKKCATILGVDATTITNPDNNNDKFYMYEELDTLISTVSQSEKFCFRGLKRQSRNILPYLRTKH